MKEFSCGDVVPGCTTRFRASSDQELLEQVAAHAREVHGLVALPDELVASVRRNIHAVDDL